MVAETICVSPLLKKLFLDCENLKNYRPVSNLCTLAKVTEKMAMKRLYGHFDENNLREPLQSAYRPGHSTETALVKVFNDCLTMIDKKQCVLLVLLDLSAAFDTVDHSVMLQRLEKLFGVTGSALEWLRSYFSERFQRVVVGDSSSKPVELTTGVPQGSVVGPGAFSAYTKPLGSIIREHESDLHLYADDTQLYVGCHIADCQVKKEKLEKQ